jgi:hypothetical protein
MVTKNVSNTGAMSNQSAKTGATPTSQNIIGGGLSPMGGGNTISPGIQPSGATGGGGGVDLGGLLHNTGSFLENLVSGLSLGGKYKGTKKPKQTASVPSAPGGAAGGAATPAALGTTNATKPVIDPMAMKLFFSTIIGPYLDQIVQQQNASADQLGSQMQHALSDFSIPDNARGLLESSSAQAQADIKNVAQTQRAAAASAPDLAAFMAQLQASQNSQELSRLEQQRVLAAQQTANGTATTDPALQAIIDSLTTGK